jgi:hypothetical protein
MGEYLQSTEHSVWNIMNYSMDVSCKFDFEATLEQVVLSWTPTVCTCFGGRS